MDISTDIGRLRLKNPVITASGTCEYGLKLESLYDLNALGGISIKGLHVHPQRGNAPLRIMETPCGMLNAIGLPGIGIEEFRVQKMSLLRRYAVPIIANFWGKTLEEYQEALKQLNDVEGLAAVEVNVSCPNVKEGGIHFGTDEKLLGRLMHLLRKETSYPMMVKLSPNVTDIGAMARVVESEGADSVSLVNTFSAMMIDVETRKPLLSNIVGGLSGPAIRPIAVRMVWEVARAVRIPVIGIGGIMSARDALEFIIAGASAVQIGTANFVDPMTPLKVIQGIQEYCVRHRVERFEDLIASCVVE